MMQRVVPWMLNRSHRPRGAWQHIVVLLVLAIGVHQFVMAMPAIHMRIMPGGVAATYQGSGDPCDGPCGSGVNSDCPAAVAAIPQPPALAATVMLLIALGLAFTLAEYVVADAPGWLWPPDRRRALLQVFLI